MHRADKYSQRSSISWPVWLNGWVFVYKLNGFGFESSWSHLNFRFSAGFEQGVPWHSGNYSVDSPWNTHVTWQKHTVSYQYVMKIYIDTEVKGIQDEKIQRPQVAAVTTSLRYYSQKILHLEIFVNSLMKHLVNIWNSCA